MKKAINRWPSGISLPFGAAVKNSCIDSMTGLVRSFPANRSWFFFTSLLLLFTSCKKLVSISDPTDRIVTDVVFSTDDLANAAMNGVYKTMVNDGGFSWGASTLYGALSSDELTALFPTSDPYYAINTNHVIIARSQGSGTALTDNIWSSAYGIIYTANAVIEGIAASTSTQLHDNVRKALTAEAKCIRAFCYFYLTNFYGDVPLILTTKYNESINVARSTQALVYQQIIQDLKDAESNLPPDYSAGGGKRVRVNKWAAAALLARAYLFKGEYALAAATSTEVINNTSTYGLEPNLNDVFLTTSREAIWQLNQKINASSSDATPDVIFSVAGIDTASLLYSISPQLLNAFEAGDARRESWIDSTVLIYTGITVYYPYKYKLSISSQTFGGDPAQYYMVLRLAEQYLIRAEAEANGVGGGPTAAMDDLNIVRSRAGLLPLSNLTLPEVFAAVAHEWQTEFFCEWGLRWFNLKRKEQAHNVLSIIPLKQPWVGDYQLLYPVPEADISLNHNLSQNTGY